ncbi:MAG: flagellar biosynthesis protein FlgF [Rhodobacterales bacterium]|nr:MAG: flagellar biosynthesis protein FlgF [Rhodobacterales bacterium]
MNNAGYIAATRQSGLMREMRVLANNIANLQTTGFQGEALVFSEFVRTTGDSDSLSMATARGRIWDHTQGQLKLTGGTYDVAIEGDGFFLVETPNGSQLTRAGHFTPDATGTLVTPDGHRVLDVGEGPIAVPPGVKDVAISADGTLSAEGRPLAQLAVVTPVDRGGMMRRSGALFDAPGGWDPVPEPQLRQGRLESANINPVHQMSRMIEVQRAYELSQSFLDQEDERIRGVLTTLGR